MRRKRFTTTISTVAKIFWHFIKFDEERMNNAIYTGFTELGGVYVKFLQILTMRTDSMNKANYVQQLAVFDDVDSEALDLNFILQHELGDNVRYFKHIELEPFAAGSFGQVYRAFLHDDRQVIIKILRPSLLRYLSFDLKLLRFFTGIMKIVTPKMIYDINEIFKDFKKVVTEETDYIKEVKHANEFFERYQGHPHIVVPQTYLELSTKYIITQDYLDGIAATKLIEWRQQGVDIESHIKEHYDSDLELLTKVLGYELIYSVLTADLIQGDPHPGNIKILPGNKLGIMDFGITAPPPDDRQSFKALLEDFIAMYYGEFDIGKFFMDGLKFWVTDLYQAINTVAQLYERDADSDLDLSHEVSKAATKAFNSSSQHLDVKQMLFKGQIANLFEQTINEGNRFGIKISFDGSIMMRAASTYMSIADGFGYRQQVIPGVFEDVLTDIKKNNIQLTGKPDTMELDRAIEIISDWIEDITERDPFLFRDLIMKMRKRINVQ